MSVDENTTCVLRQFEELWNNGQWITSPSSVGRRLMRRLGPNFGQHAVNRSENHCGILKLDKMHGIWDELVPSACG